MALWHCTAPSHPTGIASSGTYASVERRKDLIQECPDANALPEVHEALQVAKRPDKYTVFWDEVFCAFYGLMHSHNWK